MNYEAAAKQVRANKKRDTYLVFTFNYGDRYVLPHADGIALMTALQSAEKMPLYFGSGKPPEISQVGTGAVRVEPMSQEEYEDIKIAALLNIPLEVLAESKKPKQEAFT